MFLQLLHSTRAAFPSIFNCSESNLISSKKQTHTANLMWIIFISYLISVTCGVMSPHETVVYFDTKLYAVCKNYMHHDYAAHKRLSDQVLAEPLSHNFSRIHLVMNCDLMSTFRVIYDHDLKPRNLERPQML
jgi:hypothetical protein